MDIEIEFFHPEIVRFEFDAVDTACQQLLLSYFRHIIGKDFIHQLVLLVDVDDAEGRLACFPVTSAQYRVKYLCNLALIRVY